MMRTVARHLLLVVTTMPFVLSFVVGAPAGAQSKTEPTAAELAEQLQALKREYEARIGALEAQLTAMESRAKDADQESASTARAARPASDNAFNPAIGIVLNGLFSQHSEDEFEIHGFPVGHESERAEEGLSLGHSEIAMSASIDDKFLGNLTLGLGVHPGEPTEVELEEAYIQTLPGAGVPEGMRIKAGRSLWTFGYLNEQHAHGDDFADRPLPYRAFLDNAYNDDGVEVSFVLPTETYSELGAGLFRGDDFPFGGSSDGLGAWSAFARVGGDFGRDSAWRLGGYVLDGKVRNRGGGHGHEDDDEDAHEEAAEAGEEEHDEHGHAELFSEGMFRGDARLYAIDFRSTWAPTGNAHDREVTLQSEYFWRKERGTYELAPEEDGETPLTEDINLTTPGWYLQGVYKFRPGWRVGARYSRLIAPREMELERDPTALAIMLDWSNSEFSRIRLQFNRESFVEDEHDNQVMLQYIMSLGAHPAHTF